MGAACTARHVRQDAVLKFALKADAGPEHNLELVDAAATADARSHAPSMFLSRDKRLERLRGTPVLQPGRLLHATALQALWVLGQAVVAHLPWSLALAEAIVRSPLQ